MKNTNQNSPPVNKKEAPYFLSIHPSLGPTIRNHNGSLTRMPDDPFGRWFIRTHYPHLEATPEAKEWYLKHDPLRPMNIEGLRYDPRPYQLLTLARMLFGNSGEFLDMGLGKTFVAIAYYLLRFSKDKDCMALVVCPPSVFITWHDELYKLTKPHIRPDFVLAHGIKRKRVLRDLRTKKRTNPTLIATSYDTLASVLDEIKNFNISCIFLDESQRIKNIKSKRSQAAFALSKQHPTASRFLLSGTPSTTNPKGFFAQYEWLGKGFSGSPNFTVFENTYSISKLFMRALLPTQVEVHILAEPDDAPTKWLNRNFPPGQTQTYAELGYRYTRSKADNRGTKNIRILNHYPRKFGNKNLDQLHAIAQTYSYTVKKHEVMKDLPPKIPQKREIILNKQMQDAYSEMLEKSIVRLKGKTLRFSDRTSPYVKLHTIANGFIKSREGSIHIFDKNPKLDVLEEIIEESGDQKIIVWSPYIAQLRQVLQFLSKKKIERVKLQGQDSTKQRMEAVHSFQHLAKTKVLVANPSVGGVGLNLQVASLQVFMANWWTPEFRTQAIDRSHRPGQKNSVTIIDIVAKGTLETKLLRDLYAGINTENKIIEPSDLTGECI